MLTTGQWLRLIVLAALNLLLFRGIWWILIFPPVALVTVVVNLGLACTWVRPRSLNRATLAAMGAGLGVAAGSLAYLADRKLHDQLAGAIVQALPDTLYTALPWPLRLVLEFLDFAMLHATGIATMLITGWLAWPRSRARRVSSAS